MKMFSECSGPCETCKTFYVGLCFAGRGDDDYDHASHDWITEQEDKTVGVHFQSDFVRDRPWKVRVKLSEMEYKTLGFFETEEEAAEAYGATRS